MWPLRIGKLSRAEAGAPSTGFRRTCTARRIRRVLLQAKHQRLDLVQTEFVDRRKRHLVVSARSANREADVPSCRSLGVDLFGLNGARCLTTSHRGCVTTSISAGSPAFTCSMLRMMAGPRSWGSLMGPSLYMP